MLSIYMLRISYTRSAGISNSYVNAYHSFSREMESYAFSKSMNATPSFFLLFILCAIIVYSMKICSTVE